MINFSNFAATDIPLSQSKITNDFAETTIYFDFMLQSLVLDTWPESFSKKVFTYFINNLVVEITMFKK